MDLVANVPSPQGPADALTGAVAAEADGPPGQGPVEVFPRLLEQVVVPERVNNAARPVLLLERLQQVNLAARRVPPVSLDRELAKPESSLVTVPARRTGFPGSRLGTCRPAGGLGACVADRVARGGVLAP